MWGLLKAGIQRLGISRQELVEDKPATRGYQPIGYHRWGLYPREMPPFTFLTVQQMMLDPTVRLGLAMRAAPLFGLEFAYQVEGQWQQGIRASSEEIAAFVLRQLQRIWSADLDEVLKSQTWGWSAGEVTYRLVGNQVHVDRLLARHPNDCRARARDSELVGIRVLRCENKGLGYVDLDFPKCWWHVYAPEPGLFYGISACRGCYSPWWDKWMQGGALDVRRLFMHKDAYAGADLTYPEGMMYIPGKGEVPNRDIAREIVEQVIAGGVTVRPAERGANGEELWALTRAQVASNPGHILQYPKDLDVEILRGLEIADDVIAVDTGGTGSWAGKRVPMAAFYASLDCWATRLILDLDSQVIRPLVKLNFGDGHEYAIEHKPLAEQAMEQQGQGQQQAGPDDQQGGSENPFQMSLGGAVRLAAAARRVMAVRMASDQDDNPWKPYKGERGGTGWKHSETGDVRYVTDRPGKHETGSGEAGKKQPKPKKDKATKEAEADERFEAMMKDKTPEDSAAFRQARADGVAIPPAWTEVTYFGADKDIIAEGRDAKGRKQRAENPAYRKRISAENNARISRDLFPNIGKLREQLRADAMAGDEEAKCLYLIAMTGFRIGGAGDGKAKEKAYGASTLMGEHVTVDGDTVTFDFTGKKGVLQHHIVQDPVIAGIMKEAKPGQPIFKTRDAKVRDAWKKYGGVKVHDIRHVIAREEAERALAELIPPPPKNKKEQAAVIKQAATRAASRLGNNPSEALGTYIDPDVWSEVKVAA
jgi:DNA topoisomerase-1